MKIRPVAAAMSAAISHSSRWLSARLSTRSKIKSPISMRNGREHSLPTVFGVVSPERASVHLDVEFLGEKVEHLLPDPALGPFVSRLHRFLPRRAIGVSQIMQRGL